MKNTVALLFLLLALVPSHGGAQSPADCKSVPKDELIDCVDKSLNAVSDELTRLYKEKLSTLKGEDRDEIVRDQTSGPFVRREVCSRLYIEQPAPIEKIVSLVSACLELDYRSRIAWLTPRPVPNSDPPRLSAQDVVGSWSYLAGFGKMSVSAAPAGKFRLLFDTVTSWRINRCSVQFDDAELKLSTITASKKVRYIGDVIPPDMCNVSVGFFGNRVFVEVEGKGCASLCERDNHYGEFEGEYRRDVK